jgi:hypothetical protein
VPDRRARDDGGTKLSPQTLIVASLASLTAAIVTSTFWQRGTPITAALTPVIVALASELYSRPAKRITQLSARANVTRSRRFTHEQARVLERERVTSGAPPDRWRPESLSPPDDPDYGPMRVYRTEQRSSPIRRVHVRAALVTAAIAFVIAVAVLTLPELVFGGSVAAHGRTTFFSSGHRHKSNSSSSSDKKHNTTTQTTPTTSAPSSSTTTPAPTTITPAAPPAQTAPQTTTPVTPVPSPSPAPSGTSTPTQAPPGQ